MPLWSSAGTGRQVQVQVLPLRCAFGCRSLPLDRRAVQVQVLLARGGGVGVEVGQAGVAAAVVQEEELLGVGVPEEGEVVEVDLERDAGALVQVAAAPVQQHVHRLLLVTRLRRQLLKHAYNNSF